MSEAISEELGAPRGEMADRGFRVVVAGAGVAGLFMAETLVSNPKAAR
jgi:hypothetical protein